MTGGEKRLIVNADDLGRTLGINSGIFAAHRRGLVTSATLMVGGGAAEDAAAQLALHPELGIGLHLTLTGGTPILAPARVSSLVDDQGRFATRPRDLGGAVAGEVQAEAEAQVERFRELTGRLPTHLDSHHHSHRVPVVCEVLVGLARQLAIPVRNASPAVAERLRAARVRTTDFFIEEFFAEQARLEDLLRILAALRPGVTELMCHPAHVDAALREQSGYVDDRERELAALTDPVAFEAVQREGIQLTHFGRLRELGP